MRLPFRSRITRRPKRTLGWVEYRHYWRIDRGWKWCRWPSWGLTVFVEVVIRDRIGGKLRLGPVLVWWWATAVVEQVKHPIVTGTPTLFGVPLTSPPSGSSLSS